MKLTKPKKINIAIIFGGKSAEHEVSIRSAQSVLRSINKSKYNLLLIGIDKDGGWHCFDEEELLSGKQLFSSKNVDNTIISIEGKNFLVKRDNNTEKIDLVFPLLHGPFGEDGTLQGFLKLFNIPFVGASVIGSAIGMDKDVAKRLLQEAKIPTAKFLVCKKKEAISFEEIQEKLGLPFFIKPANLGSSVGISKVKNQDEFMPAVELAFAYDNKILIEEFIEGKEIECAVLGNEKPIASVPGEIIPNHEFYSYEAKYLDENGAALVIPAKLSESIVKEVQKLALKTFAVLCCEGMGRVDFFITSDNKVIVSEINTIPGFTAISMYPKLWEYSGISYTELIDKLIELAIQRHKLENKLKTT